jgi:DNA-binding XRE family transcriptional regulator
MGNRLAPAPQVARRGRRAPGVRSRLKAGAPSRCPLAVEAVFAGIPQGLTQAEVASRLGISQAAYAQTERAKRPRNTTLLRIADALGLDPEQLRWQRR